MALNFTLKKAYEAVKVLDNKEIVPGIFELVVACDRQVKVGQFFMLKGFSDLTMLPRPLSIYDKSAGTLSFLYAVVGRGTNELANKKTNDYVEVLGPLGNGFTLPDPSKQAKIALVAGGIGIAPFLYLAKEIERQNIANKWQIDLLAGFQHTVYAVEAIAKHVDKVIIATNDGSVGHKGFVTDLIQDSYDYVYCCGPTPMMKSLQNLNLQAETFLSLENRMACGIGACLACSCKTSLGMQRVCKEGPVFRASEVAL